ncbi:MAG: TGS domain-containing protein, partial [Planctomycetota bacterium]
MSAPVRVTLPDGNSVEVEKNSTCAEVAAKIGPGLAKAAVGALWNGELVSLEQRVPGDGILQIITKKSTEAIQIVRHSAAHLCAAAVLELFPGTQLGFGPPTETGFYYDFLVKEPFTPEDLERIEERMREMSADGLPFERVEMNAEEAAAELRRLGYELKAQYLDELQETDEVISFYRNEGRFADMCKGPHVGSFRDIGAFKILGASGAYWRGDATNAPMQRIHGTAFPTQKKLDDFLEMLEEARKRDHRKLGPELGLFTFHEESPGFSFWHKGGVILWDEVENLIREELVKRGYDEIKTPLVLTDELWHRSGHYDHYRDN